MSRTIGVCSWSLRAGGPRELVDRVIATGLGAVQLALDPIRRREWNETETIETLREAGVAVASGMMEMVGEDYSTLEAIKRTGGVRQTPRWSENLDVAHADAELARRLGVSLVTFHAGFIPHDRGDPERSVLVDRLRAVADAYRAQGVRVAFETGQESAATLLDLLAQLDRDDVGVNFDPANMILYGTGDPIAALEAVAPHVVQVHVKDATPASEPGAWGEERPAGRGSVDWAAFFRLVQDRLPSVPLMVERESGEQRLDDVIQGRALIRGHLAEAASDP